MPPRLAAPHSAGCASPRETESEHAVPAGRRRPGRKGEAGDSWPSWALLQVGVPLLACVDLVQWASAEERGHFEEPHNLIAVVGSVLALFLRSRWPILVLLLTLPGLVLGGMLLAAMIAMFHVALRHRPPLVAGCAVAALVVGLTDSLISPSGLPDSAGSWLTLIVYSAALTVAPAALGVQQRIRRALTVSLRALEESRAEELRLTHRLAAAGERAALARELHDSIGHATSLIALRTAALASRTSDPAAARDAAAILTLSQQALDEMRLVTGALRTGDQRAPTFGIRDLPQLIERAARDCESKIALEAADRWPPAAQAVAYRVVQEGLTNRNRYAPGSWLRVTVDSVDHDSYLVIEVHNGPSTQEPAPPRSGATGLRGLRERITAIGGELVVRRTPDSGFLLRTAIPALMDAPEQRPAPESRMTYVR